MRLLTRPDERLKLLLPLAAVLAAAVFGVTELAYQGSTTALASLASRGVARQAINTVLRRLLDAETAQRGYLLTGRSEYLGPGQEATADIAEALAKLERHYGDQPRLLGTVHDLRKRVDEKQSELSATLRMYNDGQNQNWRDLLMTDIGREKMEAVRVATESLMAAEDPNVQAERAGIYRTLSLSRASVHLLAALSLLALVFYVRKIAALERARQLHANELQAERDELETQVRHRTSELTELARHLQTAREDERSHLARELHDELGALLTAAKLDVARLKRAMGPPTPEQDQRLKHLNSSIDQGISLKRRIIEDLRPSTLSNLGLVAALEIQAREFGARANLAVRTRLVPVALEEPAQMTVYRVVQESFTNIAKYAGASEVQLSLHGEAGRVHLAVEDNGCGFDSTRIAPRTHGLSGMRFRVEAAGGQLSVVSAPGRGTLIEAWLPAQPLLNYS